MLSLANGSVLLLLPNLHCMFMNDTKSVARHRTLKLICPLRETNNNKNTKTNRIVKKIAALISQCSESFTKPHSYDY